MKIHENLAYMLQVENALGNMVLVKESGNYGDKA